MITFAGLTITPPPGEPRLVTLARMSAAYKAMMVWWARGNVGASA